MTSVARKRQIFTITWLTYAGFYLCRKNLSIVMPLLHGSVGLNSLALANIVFGYSLLYVIGQFVCGPLSDRFGAKRVVGAGLVLVVISNLAVRSGCLVTLAAGLRLPERRWPIDRLVRPGKDHGPMVRPQRPRSRHGVSGEPTTSLADSSPLPSPPGRFHSHGYSCTLHGGVDSYSRQ